MHQYQKDQKKSRSRQSRQSRQSAAQEKKQNLTDRAKASAGTGASSSLIGTNNKQPEVKEVVRRPYINNTDKALRRGVIQFDASQKADGQFRVNQFNIDEETNNH